VNTDSRTIASSLDIKGFQIHNPAELLDFRNQSTRRPMRYIITILLASIFASAYACKSTPNQPAAISTPASAESPTPSAGSSVAATSSPGATTPAAKVDACSLLTSADIQAVQGEDLKTTKASQQSGGNLLIDICYYELPTPANSISLALAQPDPQKRGSVKEFWENTFGEAERGGRKEKDREGEGEIEEGAPPRKIGGLGEEAFWFSSPIGGVLYVLKGDHYIRISVGGKGNSEAKLNKSKTLAKKALARL